MTHLRNMSSNSFIPTILVIVLWSFFYCRSNSTKVKGNLTSSITNLVYELLHELPNNLLRNLQNQETYLSNSSEDIGGIATQPSAQPSPFILQKLKPNNSSKQHAKIDIKVSSLGQFNGISLFCTKCFVRDCEIYPRQTTLTYCALRRYKYINLILANNLTPVMFEKYSTTLT